MYSGGLLVDCAGYDKQFRKVSGRGEVCYGFRLRVILSKALYRHMFVVLNFIRLGVLALWI
jgi:hypothetical protein